MKKVIAWPVAWALFWMGDMVCRPLHLDSVDRWPQWLVDAIYGAYNRLMQASSDVQEWGGLSAPWKAISAEDACKD